LASAVAVTSIPVISRIFHDLGILHTRFASLILGSAVLEDIALWGVLAVATALTHSGGLAEQGVAADSARHVLTSLAFAISAIFVLPQIQRWLRSFRFNLIYKASPLAYAVAILFVYVGAAAALNVNLVFAAFLAGFGLAGGIPGGERVHFKEALESISRFSYAVFIPIYFALVGYRLTFGREFSPTMLICFFIGSSLLALVSVGLAAKLAGFTRLDAINLAVTTNARGGPGIVLASVAFDAGIISGAFYTTLVLTAIFTSQLAAMWLSFVLSRRWPLLSSDVGELTHPAATPYAVIHVAQDGGSHASALSAVAQGG
jgi:Kef-type K+ transport system membrane component KefB